VQRTEVSIREATEGGLQVCGDRCDEVKNNFLQERAQTSRGKKKNVDRKKGKGPCLPNLHRAKKEKNSGIR